MDVVELVNKYGFPIVMAVGMGFIIKYVWEWSTKEVRPVLSEANGVLIALIDLCYTCAVKLSNTSVLKQRKPSTKLRNQTIQNHVSKEGMTWIPTMLKLRQQANLKI